MGLSPVTRDAAPAGKQYPFVLFAAPPSGSEDYPGAVSDTQDTRVLLLSAGLWRESTFSLLPPQTKNCTTDSSGSCSSGHLQVAAGCVWCVDSTGPQAHEALCVAVQQQACGGTCQ